MKVDEKILQDILTWLEKNFQNYKLVNELYLTGSSLDKFEINDIDIVQKLAFESKESLKEYAMNLEILKINFFNTFKIPLHVTSFTENESNNFAKFMSLNHSKRII